MVKNIFYYLIIALIITSLVLAIIAFSTHNEHATDLDVIIPKNTKEPYYISSLSDNNIMHIFCFEIAKYYNPNYKHVYIDASTIDKDSQGQQWRYFVMKKLYPTVQYIKNIPPTYRPPQPNKSYDYWKFIKYKPSVHLLAIYRKLNSNHTKGNYILLNQRDNGTRYLYENNSGLKLEEFLTLHKNRFKIPVKYCNFSKMTPKEQFDICSNARIFITAHGAACTNILFTPPSTPLIEINFRKHWYCDPVCDEHLSGKLSINEKCNGKLTWRPYFHKADYHNLCYLIEKPYIEIEAVKYGEGFSNTSPISKKTIYIDGEKLIHHILKIYPTL